ncbi:MAG: hypothetical protein NWQ54_09700 [Paraglaciecola sp.]|nr:hypothetical protein [Paraglaciecola sp.]
MHNNPLRFQLSIEWRYWQGQRFKLLFLLCSFSVATAVLTLLLQLGSALFSAPPAWSNPAGNIYTLAQQHHDKRLAPVHLQAIDIASQTPGIIDYTWFSLEQNRFAIASLPEQELQVLFYANNFAATLGIAMLNHSETEAGVWLSERFWREQTNRSTTIVDSTLFHPRFNGPVPILGVLPAALNRIGPHQPDIWLPDNFKRFLTPFAADSGVMLDRFLKAAPFYYGLLFTKQSLAATELTQHLRQQDLTVPGMNMARDGSKLVVLEGLTLDPPAQKKLQQQWQLALVLLVGFMLVLSFNTLAIFTNRLIQQQENYRIQLTLGANLYHLLQGPLLLFSVMLISVALCSWLILILLHDVLMQQNSYLVIVGEQGLPLDSLRWLAALTLIALLLLCCTCFPLLRLNRQALFSRKVGQSRSFSQKLLAQINLSSQLLIAAVALGFLLNLGWQQWQQFYDNALDDNVVVLQVKQRGQGVDVSALVQNTLPQLKAADIAFALTPFSGQNMIEIQDGRLDNPIAVQLQIVSGNYFSRLGLRLVQGETDWSQGVIINHSLAQFLGKQPGIPLQGSQLELGGLLGRHVVQATVDNLPHQGRSQSPIPTIYLHINSAALWAASSRTIEFYYPKQLQATISLGLTDWLSQQMSQPEFAAQRKVSDLVAEQDRANRYILGFSAVIIITVLFTIFFSLYFQIRSRITLEQQEYAVLLALGAEDWRLIFRAASQALTATIISLPFAFALLVWLLSPAGWLNSFSIALLPALLILASCLMLVLVLIAATLPIIRLLRAPIFSLLRSI